MSAIRETISTQQSSRQTTLLKIRDLTVEFDTSTGWAPAVRGVSLDVKRDEVFGLVGESGSGKSVTAMSILNLLPRTRVRTKSGSIEFDGMELIGMRRQEIDRIRGSRIGTIFQEPMTSLNPSFTIGEQIAESIRRHLGATRRAARLRAVEMLDQVGIANAHRRFEEYPHHFSGGMRQRAMIAMALACEPQLLIADEPTTALDVTVQAMILDLIREMRDRSGMSVLLITHDLGVVAEIADQVGVLYAGEIVESGATRELFDSPRHPYSSGMMQAILRLDDDRQSWHTIDGHVPEITDDVVGCRFHPRCIHSVEGTCTTNPIELTTAGNRSVRCARSVELNLKGVS